MKLVIAVRKLYKHINLVIVVKITQAHKLGVIRAESPGYLNLVNVVELNCPSQLTEQFSILRQLLNLVIVEKNLIVRPNYRSNYPYNSST